VDEVVLPGGNSGTSRLGFGASRVLGGSARKHSLMLLETAFDEGIRHFDTAPSYGSGGAEDVLGEFLARHSSECTVTSKFGIPRPQGAKRFFYVQGRAVARLALRRVPAVKARLVRATQAKAVTMQYGPDEMWISLQSSLHELGLDRLDLFLLHEIELENITEDLKDALRQAVNAGLIGTWGIAGDRSKVERIVESAPSEASVLQFEWSILSQEAPSYSSAFVITYRALFTAYRELRSLLTDQKCCRRWSDEVGEDLADDKTLARLMLRAALDANQNGIVLFSSDRPERIRVNAAALTLRSDPAVEHLVGLVRHHRQQVDRERCP
jgi:D-threo-aldose 1-dehydrogenase